MDAGIGPLPIDAYMRLPFAEVVMDPRDSPYVPGGGTRPFALTGRERELERFSIMLDRLRRGRPAEPVIYAGRRGTGKTVLLRECSRIAKGVGWFTSFDEVHDDFGLRDLIALNARAVLLEMSDIRRFRERARRALGVLRAFSSVSAMGVTLTFDVESATGTADSGVLTRDLVELFREVSSVAADQQSGVLFFLDELHRIAETDDMDALDAAVHAAAQEGWPVSVTGAGVFGGPAYGPDGGAKPITYAGRIYRVVRLGLLDDRQSRVALTDPAADAGVDYTGTALDRAVDFCGGLPWFLQLVGDLAWEAAGASPIDEDAVSAAIAQAEVRLRQEFFPPHLAGISADARELLAALAARGGWSSESDLEGALGIEWNEFQSAVNELIRGGVIAWGEPSSLHDGYGLAVPRLCEYIQARYPEACARHAPRAPASPGRDEEDLAEPSLRPVPPPPPPPPPPQSST